MILHQFSVVVVRGIREKDEEARAELQRWKTQTQVRGMAGVGKGRAGEQKRSNRGGSLERVAKV